MLTIAYSGSLDAYQPEKGKKALKWLKDLFWTFKNDQVDRSTRSAYYLIKAIKILKEEHGIGPDKLQFHFWGLIAENNLIQAEQEGVGAYFRFGTYVDKQTSLRRLQEADLLFLPLEKSNTPEHRTLFIPGKLYEYLNAGKPVLALAEPSDCRTILQKSGLGICAYPDNPSEIAMVILQIINEPGFLNGFKPNQDYISTFSFRNKTAELAAVFDQFIVE